MQLQEVAQKLRQQITLREQAIRIPSDEDVARLVKEGYVRDKPHYYPADIGEFIQAWSKYLKDHPVLPIPKRFIRWLQAKLRHGRRAS